ncbi:hypothetical protein LWM68_27295 [Niabella sp. W65]|nr:hypothetical protein [Niabella sp. W65]MCH7366149.1 hypothetical protein [Niabella sp. W65]
MQACQGFAVIIVEQDAEIRLGIPERNTRGRQGFLKIAFTICEPSISSSVVIAFTTSMFSSIGDIISSCCWEDLFIHA